MAEAAEMRARTLLRFAMSVLVREGLAMVSSEVAVIGFGAGDSEGECSDVEVISIAFIILYVYIECSGVAVI